MTKKNSLFFRQRINLQREKTEKTLSEIRNIPFLNEENVIQFKILLFESHKAN